MNHAETFFSDQKSRGFHLHHSHLSDPQRLMRLMMAACLAYLWIIYLGCMALAEGWLGLIHRTNRCDWSLFVPTGLALARLLPQRIRGCARRLSLDDQVFRA